MLGQASIYILNYVMFESAKLRGISENLLTIEKDLESWNVSQTYIT